MHRRHELNARIGWHGEAVHAETKVWVPLDVNVDGHVLTPWGGLTQRSLVLNDDATLMVLDEHVGQQMNAIFFDDLQLAEEITLERFRQRRWTEGVAEAVANLMAPLL